MEGGRIGGLNPINGAVFGCDPGNPVVHEGFASVNSAYLSILTSFMG